MLQHVRNEMPLILLIQLANWGYLLFHFITLCYPCLDIFYEENVLFGVRRLDAQRVAP